MALLHRTLTAGHETQASRRPANDAPENNGGYETLIIDDTSTKILIL